LNIAPFETTERIPTSFLANPSRVRAKLRKDWQAFHEEKRVGENIRSAIAKSWTRSLALGVSPDRRAADVDRETLSGFEGRQQIKRLFGLSAKPVTRELSDELAGSNSAIVLCDETGIIVSRTGDASILSLTERQNFVPGASWNEQCAGTNGIGLALALGRPAQVFAAEHYCIGFQGYACTAAPVRHPVTRELIGVLDVTMKASEITHHTCAMVVHAARDIERQLEEHILGRERQLLERYLRGRVGLQVPFITVDHSGRTIIQNALAAEEVSASEDLPRILVMVRDALRDGMDMRRDLDLSLGRADVCAHLVRAGDEVIGAVVAVEPLPFRPPAREKPKPAGWQPLHGRSRAIRQVIARAERVALALIPAVIEGEPGTGKQTLAEAMHARSSRHRDRLAVVNFATRNWRQDWEKATRSGGTLVLRRLTALSETQQLDLAESIEGLRGRPRTPWTIAIVTVGNHTLRLELLHRLGPGSLVLPPLREHTADIEAIVESWQQREAKGLRIADDALAALRSYRWPGNARELLNTLNGASLQASGSTIRLEDLDITDGTRAQAAQPYSATALRDVERNAIDRALAQTGGNVMKAAGLLGISRSTLHRRLRTYRLIGPLGEDRAGRNELTQRQKTTRFSIAVTP
jgi:transcriptional regulator of acetoin/glycerol metabolism